MDYNKVAKDILDNVGGKANVKRGGKTMKVIIK